MSPTPTRHWIANHVFNPLVAGLTRLGVSVRGSRILAVRGRKTGAWRTTPVDLLTHEGARYLVAPSGVTHRLGNGHAGGDVELRRGGAPRARRPGGAHRRREASGAAR